MLPLPDMPLRRTALALALLLLPAMAVPAQAQDGASIVVSVADLSSRSQPPSINQIGDLQAGIPIGIDECSTATFTFQLNGVDRGRPTIELWRGNGCNVADTRNDQQSTACIDLGLSFDTGNLMQFEIEVPLSTIFEDDCGPDSGDVTVSLWMLALADPSDDATGDGQSANFNVAADLQVPTAPEYADADDSGALPELVGESEIALSWTTSETRTPITHEIFVQADACDAAGNPGLIDESLAPVATVSNTSTTVPLAGVPLDSFGGVAIRTIDSATNAGDLSEVRCVLRAVVVGFPDAFCLETDHPVCSGEACSVGAVGHRSRRYALPVGLLALGLVVLARRRRRRG
ncbi:MAG: hypothetical protein ACFCGT_08800 [Sandaracinaceae bacterium]